jgi:hypothetical protein
MATSLITLIGAAGFTFWVHRPLLGLLQAIEALTQNQLDPLREAARGHDEFGQAAGKSAGFIDHYEEKVFWY